MTSLVLMTLSFLACVLLFAEGFAFKGSSLVQVSMGSSGSRGRPRHIQKRATQDSPADAAVSSLAAVGKTETHPNLEPDDKFNTDYIDDGDEHAPAPSPEKPVLPEGIDVKAVAAEYLAMTLFVTIGCGSAMGMAKEPGSAWVLQVALTFGFAITSLAYAIGHYTSGQINCAVTFGLWLNGNLGRDQAFYNFTAQLLGSITGAIILSCIFPRDKDLTDALYSNAVVEGYSSLHALVGEFMMTFLLMFVVLETAVNPASEASHALACLAIGLSVFVAHSLLIPIDGCSINPARSFGPALVAACTRSKGISTFRDMWVFWLGPLAGAAAAAGVYRLFEK